jgi:integrase
MDENRSPALAANCTEISVPDRRELAKQVPVDTFYLKAATRPNTRKAYQSDIQQYIAWGGVLPASTELIMRYLHEQATLLNPRTLSRRLVALRHWHEYQGFPDPTKHQAVQKILRGIYNTHGTPKDKAMPLILEQLVHVSEYLVQQSDLAAMRNLALLQVGFLGSFRRSELVGIEVDHIRFVPEGIEIIIPRSKTDPIGEGQACAIPYGNDKLCAVRALKVWLENANIASGSVFRSINRHGQMGNRALSADSVNVILKQLAKRCSLPEAQNYRGHSLRRGFVTSALKKGVPLAALMEHCRWRDAKSPLGYYSEVHRFEDNAVSILMQNK